MRIATTRARLPLIMTGLALLAVPSASEAAVLERVTLNTERDSIKRMAGAQSRTVLKRDRTYVLTVSGTYSEYAAPLWNRATCGKPRARPHYRSEGTRNGRVGSDAEFAFALPKARNVLGKDCRLVTAAPQRIGDFQANTGVRVGRTLWNHPTLLGKPPVKPTRSHSYRYVVQGGGKRIKFRVHDTQPRDNYGKLRITIRERAVSAPAIPPAAPAPAA